MNSYLAITPKYLSMHKKNTRLTILSVMIAVALVTTIFSMMDVFWTFEKQQTISDYGNFHITINAVTEEEASAISSRIDVEQALRYSQLDDAELNGLNAVIVTGDSDVSGVFSSGLYNHYSILQGAYPKGKNEAVIERWASESYGIGLGDTVTISLDGATEQFQIAGICADLSNTKAEGIIGVFMPLEGERSLQPDMEMQLLIRFENHVNINKAEQIIMNTLGIAQDRIGRNERLLALMGQSMNSTVLGLYATGAVLFLLVLVAGVTMIYNTFNISVMDRIRQFGLLRCIGASEKQVKRLVKSEGRHIALRAIPMGVLTGLLLTFACSAILKFYNSSFFTNIPLFSVSAAGILAGVLIGILTVALASMAPAKKASRVSPVNAVSGGGEGRLSGKKRKRTGKLAGPFRAETALGVRNAVSRKKTLVLMSASIAISVILFLGFQVFINFMYSSMKTLKPYTADLSILSENGLDDDLNTELSGLNGVKRVYGRMFGYVDATFDASRLTDIYKQAVGDISINSDGTFTAPEKSWLISYDKNQLKWAKTDLISGTLSEDRMNENNGVIAVAMNIRNGVSMETAGLQLGDRITLQTVSGPRELTVTAILRSVPFADDNLNLATFITTQKLYTEITGDSTLDVIDIQLKSGNQEHTVSTIKSMAGADATFSDSRQKNAQATQAFLTMAVFMYGFVFVIALISILNIINTMQTSVSAKTKYIGVMRAVGMSGRQLRKMIVSEAGTYGIAGCVTGIILGAALQRFLITELLSGAHMTWKFPTAQVIIIFILILIVILFSVIGPLKKIKARGVAETIGSLQ